MPQLSIVVLPSPSLFQLDFTPLSSLETLYSSYAYLGAKFCFAAGFLTTFLAGNVVTVLILFESWDQVFCVQLRSIPQAGLGSHRRAALFRFPGWISHYFPRWKRCTHPMRILGAKFSVSASEHSSGGLGSFHLWIRVSSLRLEPHIPIAYLCCPPTRKSKQCLLPLA